MSARLYFYFFIAAILGGSFTGGMAFFVQGRAFGFDNVTIPAITPAFFVGVTAALIIFYLVRTSQTELRAANDLLEIEVGVRTAELNRSELRFRDFAESASDWFWETDERHRIIWESDRADDIAGLGFDKVRGKTRWQVPGPVSGDDEFWSPLKALLDGRQKFRDFEFPYFGDDGKTFYAQISGVPVFSQEGNFTGYRGSTADVTERKLTEERIRGSEEKFRGIFNYSSAAIVAGDDKGNLTVWNDAFQKMLGYEDEELLKFSFRDISHPDDVDSSREHLGKIFRGEIDSFRMEKRWVRKDESICWGEISVAPLRNSSGDITGTIANILDITDRKKAERELRERENQLRDFGAAASDWYWEMDENLRFSYFSENFSDVTGVAQDILLGKTRVENGNPGADPGQWREHLENVALHRPFRHFVHPRTKSDGKIVWLSINGKPVFDVDGRFRGYRGTGMDITEAKNSQQQLIDLSAAIDEMSESVVVFDSEDRFIFTNEAYRKLNEPIIESIQYGVYFEDHLKAVMKNDLASEAIGRNEEWLAETMARHRYSSDYFELRRHDGRWFLGIEKKLPSGGQVMLLTDISEIKKTQKELVIAKEVAENANQAKSGFLSSMSHELRTPMNAILGFAQLLDFNPKEPLTVNQKSSVDLILKGGNHLLELIDQVQELNMIEAGKYSLNINHVSARSVFDESLDLIRTRAEMEGIVIIDQTTGTDLPPLSTDSTRLTQVLLNLLSNAVKYNRTGGKVMLSCQELPGDLLRIGVADTGSGIPFDGRDDLFKPFERLGREAGEIEGTGIGLTITRHIIELLGGRIDYESKPGVGSTFWIDIPISRNHGSDQKIIDVTTDPSRQSERENVGGPVRTVLYVEDNRDNMRLMESIIDRIPNTSMLAAENAERGLDLARKDRPDLILMDINLPGMNGFDALNQLRQALETKHIPVIAVTAAATSKDRAEGEKAGFTEYVTKPLNVPDLIRTIEETLDKANNSA